MSGSGNIIWQQTYVRLSTGTTTDSVAQVEKAAYGFGTGEAYGATWSKKRYLGMYVYFLDTSALEAWLVAGSCEANYYEHIGFKLIDNKLYGTVADGSTESTLLLETISCSHKRLECIFDPTIPECRFYVDGEDKGAITTNLPTGTLRAIYLLNAKIRNTEAANKRMDISEWRCFQEE